VTLVKHVFGRAITFRYSPAAGGEEHIAYSLVSARLYDDYPNDTQRAGSDGSELDEQTSWTLVNEEGTGAAEYKIVFDQQADPDSTSADDHEKYFVALNYRNENSGAIVADVEQIFLYRPRGSVGKIRVTCEDIYALDGTIEDRAPDREWVQGKIELAIEKIEVLLKARGNDPRQIFNWEELNPAAKRFAAFYCCFSFAQDGSEFWLQKANFWREEAQQIFDTTKVGFDAADDGQPEEKETVAPGGTVAFLR
jgi:hypothetical protein